MYQIGKCPLGVRFLTAGGDVQKDRIEVEIVGWGRGKESWSVDHRIIIGDTSTDAPWKKVDELLNEEWPHEGGTTLPIRIFAIDSGYRTQHVYTWARKYSFKRVMVVKGRDNDSVLVGRASILDITLGGKTIKRGIRVWPIGVGIAKSELDDWLKLDSPSEGTLYPAGYCHFPEYDEEYFKQLTAEQLVVSKIRGYEKVKWEKTRDRNEALDMRVYARAAASAFGIDRFKDQDWVNFENELGVVGPPPPTEDLVIKNQKQNSQSRGVIKRRRSSFL